MVTANHVLDIARGWLGLNEKDGSFKEILDVYNAHKPLARGYPMKIIDDWCDCFVSAVAIKAGATHLIGTEVGCEEHVALFKKKMIWIEDGTRIPQPGWIILYNWDQNFQPNNGRSDHIGYVEYADEHKIICIEGNKGEAVTRREIPIGWGFIRGYAAPLYDFEEDMAMDFASLTDKEVDELLARIIKRQASLPVADYANLSAKKAVASGVFSDGDKDKSLDNPQGWVKRQDLAIVLDRLGLIDSQ